MILQHLDIVEDNDTLNNIAKRLTRKIINMVAYAAPKDHAIRGALSNIRVEYFVRVNDDSYAALYHDRCYDGFIFDPGELNSLFIVNKEVITRVHPPT